MDLNNIHTGKNISLNGHTILIGLMADPIRHSMSPTRVSIILCTFENPSLYEMLT